MNPIGLRIVWCLLLATSLAGCKVRNPLACENDPTCNIGVDAPGSCASSADCSAPTPVCDVAAETCVQCTSEQAQACGGTTPVCTDQVCQGCTAHEQCASNACLPDGSCGDDNSVAYADAAGMSNTSCTREQPCSDLADAVGTGRAFVKLAGSFIRQEPLEIANRNVTLLAPNVELRTTSGDAIVVTGTSNVTIHDLAIRDSTGHGIVNPANAGRPTVSLLRVAIKDSTGIAVAMAAGTLTVADSTFERNGQNTIRLEEDASATIVRSTLTLSAQGVFAVGPSLVIEDSTISDHASEGLSFGGGTLTIKRSTLAANATKGLLVSGNAGTVTTIERSTIASNLSGGIEVLGGELAIRNNVIHHNGTSIAAIGGMSLRTVNFALTGIVEFNTIANNRTANNLNVGGGVICENRSVDVSHNLFSANAGGLFGLNEFSGTCDFSSSTVALQFNARFVNDTMAPFDYHLTANTPADVFDAAGACTGEDFDGDPRPQGGACDFGADERVP